MTHAQSYLTFCFVLLVRLTVKMLVSLIVIISEYQFLRFVSNEIGQKGT